MPKRKLVSPNDDVAVDGAPKTKRGMRDTHSEMRQLSLEDHAVELDERRARVLTAPTEDGEVERELEHADSQTAESGIADLSDLDSGRDCRAETDGEVLPYQDNGAALEQSGAALQQNGRDYRCLTEQELGESVPGPSEESEDEDADGSEAEEFILQPMTVRQRKQLLRESGVEKFVRSELAACRGIRQSREACGCDCAGGRCQPETCGCALGGIKCQVDRYAFPCACTNESCGNPSGRVEFDAVRVRMHYIHTMTRLRLCSVDDEPSQCDLTSARRRSYLGHLRFVQEENSYCDEEFVESPLHASFSRLNGQNGGGDGSGVSECSPSKVRIGTGPLRADGTKSEIPPFSELFTVQSAGGVFNHESPVSGVPVYSPSLKAAFADESETYEQFLRSIYETQGTRFANAVLSDGGNGSVPQHHANSNAYIQPAQIGDISPQLHSMTYSLSSLYPHVRPSRHPPSLPPNVANGNISRDPTNLRDGHAKQLNGLFTANSVWPPAAEQNRDCALPLQSAYPSDTPAPPEKRECLAEPQMKVGDPVVRYANGFAVGSGIVSNHTSHRSDSSGFGANNILSSLGGEAFVENSELQPNDDTIDKEVFHDVVTNGGCSPSDHQFAPASAAVSLQPGDLTLTQLDAAAPQRNSVQAHYDSVSIAQRATVDGSGGPGSESNKTSELGAVLKNSICETTVLA